MKIEFKVVSVACVSFLCSIANAQNLNQDYPTTTEDWERTVSAVDGGVDASDAILPNPDPLRDMAAEHREIWEALSVSSWDTNSYYTATALLDYENLSEMSGQMSDGTEFSMFVNSFKHVSFAEALLVAEGTDDFDFILENMISVAYTSGLMSTVYGEVLVDGLYADWYEGDVRKALWLPLVRPDSLIFPNTLRGPCGGCHYSEALEECLDKAKTDRDRCIATWSVAGGSGTIAGFFSGVIPGLVIAAGSTIGIGLCHGWYYDDVETCLTKHTASWFVDEQYHWDLN